MGRQDRERIERIRLGTEDPISLKIRAGSGTVEQAKKDHLRFCKACKRLVSSSLAHRHIRVCWGGVDDRYKAFPDDMPIPEECPPHIIEAVREKQKAKMIKRNSS